MGQAIRHDRTRLARPFQVGPGACVRSEDLVARLVVAGQEGVRVLSGITPRRPAWKSSKALTSSARVFMTNGP
jgi:hypothetical protein